MIYTSTVDVTHLVDRIQTNVRLARERSGMNKSELARAIRCSPQHIDSIEDKKTVGSVVKLLSICEILGIDFGDLIAEPEYIESN
jgi:transcriptional regulator with XRE-family HTH domain